VSVRHANVVRLALLAAAIAAAALQSLPLLALIGALAGLATAHGRAKRRAAKSAVWASAVALVWVALAAVLHGGTGWAVAGSVLAGAVAILLNRPRRRRRKPAPLGPPGEDAA
jgi:hypothetical protein